MPKTIGHFCLDKEYILCKPKKYFNISKYKDIDLLLNDITFHCLKNDIKLYSFCYDYKYITQILYGNKNIILMFNDLPTIKEISKDFVMYKKCYKNMYKLCFFNTKKYKFKVNIEFVEIETMKGFILNI